MSDADPKHEVTSSTQLRTASHHISSKRRTNMKQFSKIVLLAFGFALVAVVLTATSQRVKAGDRDNDRDNSITRDNVVLTCTAYTPLSSPFCTAWTRTFADGTTAPFTAVPKYQVLVITDFQMSDTSREGLQAGETVVCTLQSSIGPKYNLLYASSQASAGLQEFVEAHSVTGIAVENIPVTGCLNVDGPFNAPVYGGLATPNIILRGYLTGQ